MKPLSVLCSRLDACRERIPVRELRHLLAELPIDLSDVTPFLLFDAGTYCRNAVAEGRDYEVKVLCWRAGQRSPIHDHAGSACAVKVIAGVATEDTFDVSDPLRPRRMARTRLRPGDVTASADRDAHRIVAADGDLVTLHVYAPKLTAMNTFPDAA